MVLDLPLDCRAAAEPYFAMLERWLVEGLLDDPYSEFMVQEDKASQSLPGLSTFVPKAYSA